MLKKSVVTAIRQRGKAVKEKYPRQFSLLSLNASHKTLSAIMPGTSIWLRETAGCYNTITREVIYHFVQHDSPLAVCKNCGGPVNFSDKRKQPREYCTSRCASASPEVLLRRGATRRGYSDERKLEVRSRVERTLLRNYGVTNPMKSEVIANRAMVTSIQRYGHAHPMQSKKMRDHLSQNYQSRTQASKDAIKEKIRVTSLARYGVTNPSQSLEINHKRQKAHLEKYGVEHTGQRPEIIAKIRKALQGKSVEEWGGILRKREASSMQKYGTRHHLQNDEQFRKSRQQSHRIKPTRLLGTTHSLQGYEPYVLTSIQHKIKKIRTDAGDLPRIFYKHPVTGKLSRYYVDAAIETNQGNKILLEVKSPYTLKADLVLNIAKFKAAKAWCAKNSFTFVLAISDGTSYTKWLENPTPKQLY